MAYKMELWSLTLLPGEKYPLYVRRDFILTNAALGEDLKKEDGRSVVKVSHQPLYSDDSDSEIDSDIEVGDSDEEEFELDEVEGFKKILDGEDEEEDMDEDEDDEEHVHGPDCDHEDDSEEDSDFDDEEVEETSVLCALTGGKIEQANLNITFVEGQVVTFEVSGENAVHLLGNYIHQFGGDDSDDESDSDEEGSDFSDLDDEHDDYSELYGSDEDDVPAGKITEIAETKIIAPTPSTKKAEAKPAAVQPQKRKAQEIESPVSKAVATATEGLTKKQKRLAKKQQEGETEEKKAAPVAAPKAKEAKQEGGKKRTLASGLVIEDIKTGDGPVAKTGKRLGMRYIGKLTTGKQFDANTSGKPFSFVLGRGEVIKGWDEGLAGMAVGGERRLTIPPTLAYGNQKVGGIPKGSTLKFDVKLVSVA